MTELTYQNENSVAARLKTSWGAIWAGVFTFVAIWSVFGVLGLAIFARSATSNAASTATGMSVGMGIWAIVLTIIAMYVAGRETGRLAAVATRHDGLIHGMVMFGLSVVAVLVIALLGSDALTAATNASGGTHNPYLLDLVTGMGWITFVALFLGWLAAMGGASTGAQHKIHAERAVQPMRPAA